MLSQFKVILQNPSCKDSAFVPVWIYPNSESKCRKCLINGGKDKIVCSNTNIILGNKTESTFQTFKWYPSDGLNYDTLEMPVFNKENKTDQAIILNYIITAEDTMINCIVSDTIQVTLLSEFFVDCNGIPYIHVYNTITPNGDSENESFTIDNIEFYPDNEVSVYNRWGNKVMNRKGYKNDWNGGSLSDGIYYYVVILKNVGQHYKGDLTIKN